MKIYGIKLNQDKIIVFDKNTREAKQREDHKAIEEEENLRKEKEGKGWTKEEMEEFSRKSEAEVSENSRSREFSTRVSFIFSRSTMRNDFLKSRSRLET